jgi:hypothetical protein
MTTARSMALAMMALALWQAPGAARAEVYRCPVGGRTVYQDTPCPAAAEAEPHKAASVPTSTNTPRMGAAPVGRLPAYAPPSTNFTTLREQMLDAREQSERARTLYDHDVQQAKAQAATMSLEQQRQLLKVLHARWDPQLQAAGRRERELSEALRRMCSGDASINAQTQQCSK